MLTIIAGTGLFKMTKRSEDRALPRRQEMKEGYGSKLCIENKGVELDLFNMLLDKYDDLRILWCIRHPMANALAKIKRGCNAEGIPKSVDATKETACDWIEKSYSWLESLSSKTGRVVAVKQEDLILNGLSVIDGLFNYFGIEGGSPQIKKDILMNFKHTPNKNHSARYGEKIDKSQAHIHINPFTAYDGYFKDRIDIISYLKKRLKPIVEKWYA
jgi:hypothetical protein